MTTLAECEGELLLPLGVIHMLEEAINDTYRVKLTFETGTIELRVFDSGNMREHKFDLEGLVVAQRNLVPRTLFETLKDQVVGMRVDLDRKRLGRDRVVLERQRAPR